MLALANWPAYDPAAPGDAPDDRRRNRALTDPYEPGSVLKPFTVAAALDSGDTALGELWALDGPTWRTRLRPDDHRRASRTTELTSWDVLVKSQQHRDGDARRADGQPDAPRRPRTLRLRRADRRSICPARGPGVLNPPGRWSHYSTDSVAQGYELLGHAGAALPGDGRARQRRRHAHARGWSPGRSTTPAAWRP